MQNGLPRLSRRFTNPPSNARDMIQSQGALPGIEDGHPEGMEPEEGRVASSTVDKGKSYALGGSVDADADDDNTPALDLDASDDQSSDSGQGGAQSGGDPYNNALNTVSDILNFGRQKYGLTGDQQVAGNMPAAPAGSGGEGRGQQPFQPAPGGTPFGKRNGTGSMSFAEGGSVDGPRDDEQGAYNPEGDDPVGAVLSNATEGAGNAVQGLATAAAPYTAAPMSPMEAGQGDAEMGALQGAAGAVDDATADRPSADNPLSPSSLRTALDPSTFHQNLQNIGGAMQPYMAKVISYLKGTDAAPAPAAQQAEAQVDPQGQMDPGTRKLLAIDAVQKQYGPQAAWSLMQHYRQKYDAYKAFAAAANAGTQGKPRDPAAAAMAMQQAYDHLPDGQNLIVKPAGAGFTATVTSPGGKSQTVSLTPQAFGQLTQGPDGQFDNVIEKGLPNVLTKFVQRNGLTADQVKPDTSTSAPAGSEPVVAGKNDKQQPGLGFDPQLEARARAMFPYVSQNAQRLAWMTAQEQQGTENKLGEKKIDNTLAALGIRGKNAQTVQAMKNEGNEKVATVRGQSYDRRTEAQADVGHERNANYAARTLSNADNAKMQAAARSQDARMRNAANIVRTAVGAGQMYDPKNVADPAVQQAARLLGIDLAGGGASPQAPQPQAPATQAAPSGKPAAPQVGQIVKGHRYKGGNPADPNSWEPAGQ